MEMKSIARIIANRIRREGIDVSNINADLIGTDMKKKKEYLKLTLRCGVWGIGRVRIPLLEQWQQIREKNQETENKHCLVLVIFRVMT